MNDPDKTVNRQAWGFWATFGFGILVILLLLLIQIIAAVIFIAIKYASDPQTDVLQFAKGLDSNGSFLAISTCLTAITCVGLIFLFIKFKKGSKLSDYLALKPLSVKTLLRLFFISIGFIILSDTITTLLGRPIIPQFMVDVYRTSFWNPILWFALIIAAPIFEETFIRGFLFQGFIKSRIGMTGTVVLTAIIWAALHTQYDIYQISTIFVLGILFGYIRFKTGSLFSTLFMHALCNLAATIETEIYAGGLMFINL